MDRLDQAAVDLKIPDHQSRVLLWDSPARWDEYLDLEIPVLIDSACGPWESLSAELRQSGLSSRRLIRLVSADGAVHPLRFENDTLVPQPRSADWTVALNWTHPDEGWRSRLPLWGKRYLVTRQKEQGRALIERLESLGARATAAPTIDFVAPDDPSIIAEALERLEDFEWLLFTSPNGVCHFFRLLDDSPKDHRALGQTRMACIGPGTAKALRARGFDCDVLPEEFVAEGLLEALSTEKLEGKKVLLPRAQEAREILPDTLRSRGAEVVVAPVYKTIHPALPEGLADWSEEASRVLFTSSSTVTNWVALTDRREIPCFCIGPITAGTAEKAGLKVLGTAAVHTIDGLVQTLLELDGRTESLV